MQENIEAQSYVCCEELMKIRCQIGKCPFGKPPHDRCCFGEVKKNDIKNPINAYHKCPKSGLLTPIIVTPAA